MRIEDRGSRIEDRGSRTADRGQVCLDPQSAIPNPLSSIFRVGVVADACRRLLFAVDLRPDLRASLVPQSLFDEMARGQIGTGVQDAPVVGLGIIVSIYHRRPGATADDVHELRG